MRSGSCPPAAQALAPEIRLFGGKLFRRQPGIQGVLFIDPRAQVLGPQLWEVEHQIGQIAFGVDGDHRYVIDQRLFQKCDPQPGFAASGHPDDHPVGRQVFRIIQ